MSEAKSLPRSISVTILAGTDRERVVQVEKLPLGKAATLGLAFKRIGEKFADLRDDERLKGLLAGEDFDKLPLDQAALRVLEFLPEIIEVAVDLVIDILIAGTDVTREEAEQLGLDEATMLLAAILEVNNLNAIQENLKNVMERLGLTSAKVPAPANAVKLKSGSKR